MSSKILSKTIVPKKKIVAAIRAAAVKQGKSKLSMREIDNEIRAYRRERASAAK
jgi:hypothetical protein